MATIRIAETVHHARTETNTTTTGVSDDVYNMRNISRTSTRDNHGISNLRNISRTSSRDTRNLKGGEKEAEDDDPGLRQSGDYKERQV